MLSALTAFAWVNGIGGSNLTSPCCSTGSGTLTTADFAMRRRPLASLTITARPPGSTIGTELCFHSLVNSGADINIDYCEYGVPGIVSVPITGEGQEFTMYFVYPQQATILFSGTLSEDGASVSGAEALVVYTYTIDSWAKSRNDWSLVEACDGASSTP